MPLPVMMMSPTRNNTCYQRHKVLSPTQIYNLAQYAKLKTDQTTLRITNGSVSGGGIRRRGEMNNYEGKDENDKARKPKEGSVESHVLAL